MSQQKQYPSKDEATHIFEDRYYKVGTETSYLWVGDKWEHAACTADHIREEGTPLKTQQEAQERTQDQPATTLPTPLSNTPSLPVQWVSEGVKHPTKEERKEILDRLTREAEDMGLYDMVGNPLVKPLIPSMTERNGSATCDPTSPDNRQVGGDHYKKMKIQPWGLMSEIFTKDQQVGFYLGNVYKYVMRYSNKNGVQDLEKAKHYLEKLISVLKKGEDR